MRRSTRLGFFLLVLFGFAQQAPAEPIQYVATFFQGLDGLPAMNPVNIPDPSQGGSVILGGAYLPRPDPKAASSLFETIDGNFSFQLGIKSPTGSPGPMLEPFAVVSGHINGSISVSEPMLSRLGGTFAGTATSITIPFDPPGAVVPQELLDLVHNPGRVHVSGLVTGGAANFLQISLGIDPATPGNPLTVPEPSSLATFFAILAGCLALRKYRSGAE